VRDVFHGKDDEWEDEDYAGGYGQGAKGSRRVETKAARFPSQDKEPRRIARGAPMPIAEEEEEDA
jgi:hypothetical protein